MRKTNNETLSKTEEYINLIYYIFKYGLFILGFIYLSLITNRIVALILGIVYIYISLIHKSCKESILYNIIEEEKNRIYNELRNEKEDINS